MIKPCVSRHKIKSSIENGFIKKKNPIDIISKAKKGLSKNKNQHYYSKNRSIEYDNNQIINTDYNLFKKPKPELFFFKVHKKEYLESIKVRDKISNKKYLFSFFNANKE